MVICEKCYANGYGDAREDLSFTASLDDICRSAITLSCWSDMDTLNRVDVEEFQMEKSCQALDYVM